MSWASALIQAGGSLLGGLIGKKSQEDANAQNAAKQEEFAKHGIQWRVEDAKRAGLHPLYALGGSGASFSPSAQPVMDGQHVARAASAFASGFDRELQAANLEAVRASAAKDRALAAAADSEAARNRQGSLATAPVAESFPLSLPGQAIDQVSVDGGPYMDVNVRPLTDVPPQVPKYLTGDVKPGFQRFNTSVAGEVILPAGGSMSEAVESMENPAIQLWIISENLKHYGPGAERKLRALLGDKFKWWTNPGRAVGDAVRSFGVERSRQGGN